MTTPKNTPDLLVFSHLRWDFVFQRPQHLLTRCAEHRRVYFFEEPVFEEHIVPTLHISTRGDRVHVALPRLPAGGSESEINAQLKQLVDELVSEHISARYIAWYYTPMALKFTRHLKPTTVVYDCMDELSNFKGAPTQLRILEDELFGFADVVFTGGASLFEHKRSKHSNIHLFPSSVDIAHFRKARAAHTDPQDQATISRPRIGYAGVIDERLDIALVQGIAQARPDWQLVLIGPIVKIDSASLPRGPNIHYLGSKRYDELPKYLAGWDVALLPFARNDATRFISPTKTPEYLAAGRHVVSTSIRDVVKVYGESGLVKIADEPGTCIAAIESCMSEQGAWWLARVDRFLSQMSWDKTFRAMWQLVEAAREQQLSRRAVRRQPRPVLPEPTAAALSIGRIPASTSGGFDAPA